MEIINTLIDYKAIGDRIRNARTKLGYTQEFLANQTDLSVAYMSNIENGRTKLSLNTLILIARTLDTTVDALLYDNIPVLVKQYDLDAKALLEDCTPQERAVIMDSAISLKQSLRKNLHSNKKK